MKYCDGKLRSKLGFIPRVIFRNDGTYKINENKYFIVFKTGFSFLCNKKEMDEINMIQDIDFKTFLYKSNYNTLSLEYNIKGNTSNPFYILIEKILLNYNKLKSHSNRSIYNYIKKDIFNPNIDEQIKNFLL